MNIIYCRGGITTTEQWSRAERDVELTERNSVIEYRMYNRGKIALVGYYISNIIGV